MAHPDNHRANDHVEMDKGPPNHTWAADLFPLFPGPILGNLSQHQLPAPRVGSLGPNKFPSDMTSLPLKTQTCRLVPPPQTHDNLPSKTKLAQRYIRAFVWPSPQSPEMSADYISVLQRRLS